RDRAQAGRGAAGVAHEGGGAGRARRLGGPAPAPHRQAGGGGNARPRPASGRGGPAAGGEAPGLDPRAPGGGRAVNERCTPGTGGGMGPVGRSRGVLVSRMKVGKFEILTELGKGSMGTVYKARDPVLDRLVALKTVAPGLLEDRIAVERFQREAKAAARLQHASIVTIFDSAEADGTVYIAMELL